jgi:hypothetical protein
MVKPLRSASLPDSTRFIVGVLAKSLIRIAPPRYAIPFVVPIIKFPKLKTLDANQPIFLVVIVD